MFEAGCFEFEKVWIQNILRIPYFFHKLEEILGMK